MPATAEQPMRPDRRMASLIDAANESHRHPEGVPRTMLAHCETTFLEMATREHHMPGEIVELGCFLGGSTCALAKGLYSNSWLMQRGTRIHAYDTFRWSKVMHASGQFAESTRPGESFLDVYKRNIIAWHERIRIYDGDLTQFPWHGDPISLCFVDVAKNAARNDFIVHHFFPYLEPGSLLIQQDFHWPGLPWINVTMEHLAEYFECLGDLRYNSRVYRMVKKLPVEVAQSFSYDALSIEERDRALWQLIATNPGEKWTRHQVAAELNRAYLYFQAGQAETCQTVLREIVERWQERMDLLLAFRNPLMYLLKIDEEKIDEAALRALL